MVQFVVEKLTATKDPCNLQVHLNFSYFYCSSAFLKILIIPVFFVFMGLLDHQLPLHVEILVSAVTQINEPDSLYGIIQSHKVSLYYLPF